MDWGAVLAESHCQSTPSSPMPNILRSVLASIPALFPPYWHGKRTGGANVQLHGSKLHVHVNVYSAWPVYLSKNKYCKSVMLFNLDAFKVLLILLSIYPGFMHPCVLESMTMVVCMDDFEGMWVFDGYFFFAGHPNLCRKRMYGWTNCMDVCMGGWGAWVAECKQGSMACRYVEVK